MSRINTSDQRRQNHAVDHSSSSRGGSSISVTYSRNSALTPALQLTRPPVGLVNRETTMDQRREVFDMYGLDGNVFPVQSIAAMSGDRPLDVTQVDLGKKRWQYVLVVVEPYKQILQISVNASNSLSGMMKH